MSVGSCEDAGPCRTNGGITALVVTVNADIQHSQGEHSTVILSCDKVLCGGTGVPKLKVIYTFDNNGDLTNTAGACPRKSDLGNLEICVDYVSSMRSDGDLYLHVLFDHDLRMSGSSAVELRQGRPDHAQQFEGLAGLLGKPVCVWIMVLKCDPCSDGKQESALVCNVG